MIASLKTMFRSLKENRLKAVNVIIDTTLVVLIALTLILALTATQDGVQNMARFLFVVTITIFLVFIPFSGPNSSPKNLERIGTKKPSDERGKQEKSVKKIKPLLRSIIDKK